MDIIILYQCNFTFVHYSNCFGHYEQIHQSNDVVKWMFSLNSCENRRLDEFPRMTHLRCWL